MSGFWICSPVVSPFGVIFSMHYIVLILVNMPSDILVDEQNKKDFCNLLLPVKLDDGGLKQKNKIKHLQ